MRLIGLRGVWWLWGSGMRLSCRVFGTGLDVSGVEGRNVYSRS